MFPQWSKFKSLLLELILYVTIYSITWWGLLMQPTGYWWDDWLLRTLTPEENMNIYLDQGNIFFGTIVVGLHTLSPVANNIATFIAAFFTAVFFGKVSGSFFKLSPRHVFFITVLGLVSPLVTARLLKVMTPFYIDLLLFTLAWLILTRWFSNKYRLSLWLSIPLLSLSFTTPSLLPMNYLFWGLLYYSENREKEFTKSSLLRFINKSWPIWIAPIVFWGLNRLFSAPHGLYENYNSPTLFLDSTNLIAALILCLMVLAACGFIFVKQCFKPQNNSKYSNLLKMFSAGTAMLMVATVPYILVAKPPVFFVGYDSRHQLLLVFGVCLVLLALIAWVELYSVKVSKFLFVSIVISSVALTNFLVMQFHIDFKKQMEISDFLTQDALSQNATTFFVLDNAKSLNIPRHEDYTFYEIGGWLEAAFADRNRLGVYESASRAETYSQFEEKPVIARYGSSAYVMDQSGVRIVIEQGKSQDFLSRLFTKSPLLSISSSAIDNIPQFIQGLK